ncbi:acyltransferase [Microbacterium sp. LRZ72]|uniref:acyltransferase n=1 Tax=Microbacterium sp. LRZ72 TaxID=2942481 RepID=UPI0029B0D830|nr:acyltransferase [Microbacterium sp. LRZ72]MDX2376580.1 acyltransferase [Microbacterium sp. LRZ72]
MGTAGERFHWMDQARGAAIVLVVIHHAMTWLDDFSLAVPLALLVFDDLVSPFRMPLLMFLSGMLVTRSLAKPTRAYFAGKLRGIAWPYMVWSVIFLALTGTLTLSLLPNVLLYPPTYLWFLWFLFAYYALAWVLARLRIPPLPVAAAALVAAGLLPDAYRLSRFAFLLAFFLLGWWWERGGVGSRGSVKARLLVAVTGLAMGVVVSGATVGGAATRYEPAYAWGAIGAVVAIAIVLPHLRMPAAARAIEYVGRNSLVYYVTHYTIIWALDVVLVGVLGATASWAVWSAGVVVALTVGTALSRARTRWAAAAWLFEWPRRTRSAVLA